MARLAALGRYAGGIIEPPTYEMPTALEEVRIGERASLLREAVTPGDGIVLFNRVRNTRAKQWLTTGEYMETVLDAVRLLDSVGTSGRRVAVLDFVNPFSFLTGMEPPRGDYSWFHAERNISRARHPPANALFHSVDYVLVPKFPVLQPTQRLLEELYGSYVRAHYPLRAESPYWVMQIRPGASEPERGRVGP